MEQIVSSTGIEFTSLTESPFLPESDHQFSSIDTRRDDRALIIQQIQEYGYFQVINVALAHRIDLVLRLGDQHYWIRSTKPLTLSDVNDQARLLWPNEIFPTTMSQDLVEQCRTVKGHKFKIEDIDTGTSYMMTLKQWSSGSYIWTTYWKRNFVKRRNLKENDEIGLLWDNTNSKFYFSVRKRSLNNIVNE